MSLEDSLHTFSQISIKEYEEKMHNTPFGIIENSLINVYINKNYYFIEDYYK